MNSWTEHIRDIRSLEVEFLWLYVTDTSTKWFSINSSVFFGKFEIVKQKVRPTCNDLIVSSKAFFSSSKIEISSWAAFKQAFNTSWSCFVFCLWTRDNYSIQKHSNKYTNLKLSELSLEVTNCFFKLSLSILICCITSCNDKISLSLSWKTVFSSLRFSSSGNFSFKRICFRNFPQQPTHLFHLMVGCTEFRSRLVEDTLTRWLSL